MSNLRDQFLLDFSISHFNHGSFGACPKPIFNEYVKWQNKVEQNPLRFFLKYGLDALDESKKALTSYINCDPDDLVYTTNPTYAINIIAKSLNLEPGDEVLSTNLEYGAMDRTWDYYCKKRLAKYKRQDITLPIQSKEAFLEEFWKGHTHKTRVIFISHITSSTALKLPVEEICARAKELGLLTIVDGAHVPGQTPLNLGTLKADIYTGACHKWLLTPKGCSFLYANKNVQDLFDPLLISWGYKSDTPGKSKFLDYHTSQGTRDYSAFLTVPRAIEFLKETNWDQLAKGCRDQIKELYPKLCSIVGSKPLAPLDDDFLVQMCSVPVKVSMEPFALQQLIFEKHQIEVIIFSHNGSQYLRISLQPYNTEEELNNLVHVIESLVKEGIISAP